MAKKPKLNADGFCETCGFQLRDRKTIACTKCKKGCCSECVCSAKNTCRWCTKLDLPDNVKVVKSVWDVDVCPKKYKKVTGSSMCNYSTNDCLKPLVANPPLGKHLVVAYTIVWPTGEHYYTTVEEKSRHFLSKKKDKWLTLSYSFDRKNPYTYEEFKKLTGRCAESRCWSEQEAMDFVRETLKEWYGDEEVILEFSTSRGSHDLMKWFYKTDGD